MRKLNRRTLYFYQFLFLLVFIPLSIRTDIFRLYNVYYFRIPLGIEAVIPILPLILSLFFIGQSIFFRAQSIEKRGWKRTLSILSGDYLFDDYATINFISLIYAFIQGLTLAAAWTAYAEMAGVAYYGGIYIVEFLLLLLSIPLIAIIHLFFWRAILEGVVIYFKAMQAIIQIPNQFICKLAPREESKQD